MGFIYVSPNAESDPHALPNVEVFTIGPDDDEDLMPGWYWWPCFPGCLPEVDTPFGPFTTEQAAIDNAREVADE